MYVDTDEERCGVFDADGFLQCDQSAGHDGRHTGYYLASGMEGQAIRPEWEGTDE